MQGFSSTPYFKANFVAYVLGLVTTVRTTDPTRALTSALASPALALTSALTSLALTSALTSALALVTLALARTRPPPPLLPPLPPQVGVMHFFDAAQPALLYLVPACIGAALLTAVSRGAPRVTRQKARLAAGAGSGAW